MSNRYFIQAHTSSRDDEPATSWVVVDSMLPKRIALCAEYVHAERIINALNGATPRSVTVAIDLKLKLGIAERRLRHIQNLAALALRAVELSPDVRDILTDITHQELLHDE